MSTERKLLQRNEPYSFACSPAGLAPLVAVSLCPSFTQSDQTPQTCNRTHFSPIGRPYAAVFGQFSQLWRAPQRRGKNPMSPNPAPDEADDDACPRCGLTDLCRECWQIEDDWKRAIGCYGDRPPPQTVVYICLRCLYKRPLRCNACTRRPVVLARQLLLADRFSRVSLGWRLSHSHAAERPCRSAAGGRYAAPDPPSSPSIGSPNLRCARQRIAR
jgi:hypothetical protein